MIELAQVVWTGLERVRSEIEDAAGRDWTVLLLGESGTGKEVLARVVHQSSSRKLKPFIAINCAAIADSVIEAELFGTTKGGFTGAENRPGAFEQAHQGTLFLDEIGDASSALQAKILRAIEVRQVQRVGGNRPIDVDVRLIAATNRNLRDERLFRPDLLYRLDEVSINVPAVRERPETAITELLNRSLDDICRDGRTKRPTGFTSGALDRLLRFDYPGNVRQLRNLAKKLIVRAAGREIEEDDLPVEIHPKRPGQLEAGASGTGASSQSTSGDDLLARAPELVNAPADYRTAVVGVAAHLIQRLNARRAAVEQAHQPERAAMESDEFSRLCAKETSPILLGRGLTIPEDWAGIEVLAHAIALAMRWDLATNHEEFDPRERGSGGRSALGKIYGTTGFNAPTKIISRILDHLMK